MGKSTKRILKLFAAGNGAQFANAVGQLILPAAFLKGYGIALYGEWLALSAAIGYLSTLNYGLQTYTTMQMTIHYSRGEVDECNHVQSAGLRILLSLFVISWLVLLVIFALPLDSWLRLTIPRFEAQLTLYLLGGMVTAGMLTGFLSGKYMVFGAAHRGTNWNSATMLVGVLAMAALALRHAAFYWIAGAQVSLTLLSVLLMAIDLHRLAPDIRPSLRYWKRGSMMAVLKPSSQYALLYSSNVLAYQLPILIMQRLLGPAAVVVYSVTRTIFSMGRRLVSMVTSSIGQEVTIFYGQRDWPTLHRIYDLSERVILTFTVPVTFGSMLAAPFLLHVWLHKDALYRPEICLLLGLTAVVLGIKEHKYQFQFSSNQVREISYLTITGYTIMTLLSIPAMIFFGVPGFVALWGLTEIVLLYLLLHLNARLFTGVMVLDRSPIVRLFGLLLVGSIAVIWPMIHMLEFNYLEQVVFSITGALIFFLASYRIFGFGSVREIVWKKLAGRIPLLAGNKG